MVKKRNESILNVSVYIYSVMNYSNKLINNKSIKLLK